MPSHLHHVVMRSHSAQTFVAFLTDVVGMEVQFQMRVPGEILEKTLGWPPSDGADVTMLGSGDAGLIEVLDVPPSLRDIAPEGLAALSFLTDEYDATRERATSFTDDVTPLDTGMPGVDLFVCTMGGVPVEFMGAYTPDS
ncbi:VOC family protein [Mycobacterium sp. NPDC051804]|uniref:VOC family protein n=1 Tax=Mycobacterium sp. NPDC051804 TaxID=3364295 RepID=UPI00378F7157